MIATRAPKNRKLLIAGGILIACLSLWLSYSSLLFLIHRREARAIATEVASARAVIEKMPPGFERPAEYVRRLRAIDVAQASPALRQALTAYADAMEHSLELMKQHQDTRAADEM